MSAPVASGTVLVLYRHTDLRIHDHAPLAAAHGFTHQWTTVNGPLPPPLGRAPPVHGTGPPPAGGLRVLPLFVFDPERWFGRVNMQAVLDGPTATAKKGQNGVNRAAAQEEVLDLNCLPKLHQPTLSSLSRVFVAKQDAKRARFLLECVRDLRSNLRRMGSDLCLRVGRTEDVVLDLVRSVNASAAQAGHASLAAPVTAIYAHTEYAEEELLVEAKVRAALQLHGLSVPWTLWHGNTLFQPEDLPWTIGNVPDVFTPFRQKTEKTVQVRDVAPYSMLPCGVRVDEGVLAPEADSVSDASSGAASGAAASAGATPARLPCALPGFQAKPFPPTLDPGVLPSYAELGYSEAEISALASGVHPHSSFPLPGGERSALRHLREYFWLRGREQGLPALYKETRNQLNGVWYSTKFSPFLSAGCVSARLILRELRAFEREVKGNDSTGWIYVELLFRDHFRFLAEKYGRSIFKKYGPNKNSWTAKNKEKVVWNTDAEMFRAWCMGRTGYPFIDALMRELLATGYMSNRGRQNVASFFLHDMKMDWRMGAMWFESNLIDHDVASNYGNWAYQAGVAFDPRSPYRYFNIHKQAKTYDPHHTHIRLWLPELHGQSRAVTDGKQRQLDGFFRSAANGAAAGAGGAAAAPGSKGAAAPAEGYPRPICALQSDAHPTAHGNDHPAAAPSQSGGRKRGGGGGGGGGSGGGGGNGGGGRGGGHGHADSSSHAPRYSSAAGHRQPHHNHSQQGPRSSSAAPSPVSAPSAALPLPLTPNRPPGSNPLNQALRGGQQRVQTAGWRQG